MELKDKKALVEYIKDAVADYSLYCDDLDFIVNVEVYASNGWCGCRIVETEKKQS